ncbi:MAG: hypothetical protein FD136_2022 [Chitinophagaceae bacterium]|nr:MAG: hypothetical protein FD136_2022 [Chitinophagaceae bacterium]
MYPNPTKGTVIFNLPIINNDEYDFVLTNNLGQEVFRSNIGNGGRKEMNINQLGDGLYFVQIFSNNRSYYQKLYLIK